MDCLLTVSRPSNPPGQILRVLGSWNDNSSVLRSHEEAWYEIKFDLLTTGTENLALTFTADSSEKEWGEELKLQKWISFFSLLGFEVQTYDHLFQLLERSHKSFALVIWTVIKTHIGMVLPSLTPLRNWLHNKCKVLHRNIKIFSAPLFKVQKMLLGMKLSFIIRLV